MEQRSLFRWALGKLNEAGLMVTACCKGRYLIEPDGMGDYRSVYADPELKALIRFKEASKNDVIGFARKLTDKSSC